MSAYDDLIREAREMIAVDHAGAVGFTPNVITCMKNETAVALVAALEAETKRADDAEARTCDIRINAAVAAVLNLWYNSAEDGEIAGDVRAAITAALADDTATEAGTDA